MKNTTTKKSYNTGISNHRDIRQQVTDTIVQQLENGTVPWQKPWVGDDKRSFAIPKNFTTGNKYRGINILLLWASAIVHDYPAQEWASYKQWQDKKEAVRKGEKGSMIVYYDTIEKEEDGEIEKIPFLKSSVVFNRSQLASYTSADNEPRLNPVPLVERIKHVEEFVANTGAIVEHKGYTACYIPSEDKIHMPVPEAFIDTETSTATEGYYSTLFHELTHWTGNEKRLNRQGGKKFGDENYATEELVADIGAAFLCAELEITATTKADHANYLAHWLKALKDNKQCIISAASGASRAVELLLKFQA